MINLNNKSILVTGGFSMVGNAIINTLNKRGAIVHYAPHSSYDLLGYINTQQLFLDTKPEYVIHAAGFNGGIEFNRTRPADIFYRTTKMALNVLQCCSEFGVNKVLSIISSCALPDKGEEILKAESLWEGSPNPTVECHGLSKRVLDAFSRQLNKQFGLNAVCAILTNCYGPGDSFHPLKTKVVAALIRKIYEAQLENKASIECWGSGNPRRQIMFSIDAGEALVQTLERYDNINVPLNIGPSYDITIKELTETIAKILEYSGTIKWDTSKADGQMRKMLEISKMEEILSFPFTGLEDGLQQTIKWYKNNKQEADDKC